MCNLQSAICNSSDMEVEVNTPALGDAAIHLPWLSPCAASLVALTRAPTATLWSEVRADPGCVLLMLRHGAAPGATAVADWLREPAVLDAAAHHLEQPPAGF